MYKQCNYYNIILAHIHTSLLYKGSEWCNSSSWAYHDDRNIWIRWQSKVRIVTNEDWAKVSDVYTILKEGSTYSGTHSFHHSIPQYRSTDSNSAQITSALYMKKI